MKDSGWLAVGTVALLLLVCLLAMLVIVVGILALRWAFTVPLFGGC
jgi:hypothetical protein